MEPNLRDTPLRRFNTFWWGLALFVAFGIACFFIRAIVMDDPSDADDARGLERSAIKEKVDKAQKEVMDKGIDPDVLIQNPNHVFN